MRRRQQSLPFALGTAIRNPFSRELLRRCVLAQRPVSLDELAESMNGAALHDPRSRRRTGDPRRPEGLRRVVALASGRPSLRGTAVADGVGVGTCAARLMQGAAGPPRRKNPDRQAHCRAAQGQGVHGASRPPPAWRKTGTCWKPSPAPDRPVYACGGAAPLAPVRISSVEERYSADSLVHGRGRLCPCPCDELCDEVPRATFPGWPLSCCRSDGARRHPRRTREREQRFRAVLGPV